ncbi:hypothetical protein D1872_331070 [compost metagenome]
MDNQAAPVPDFFIVQPLEQLFRTHTDPHKTDFLQIQRTLTVHQAAQQRDPAEVRIALHLSPQHRLPVFFRRKVPVPSLVLYTL